MREKVVTVQVLWYRINKYEEEQEIQTGTFKQALCDIYEIKQNIYGGLFVHKAPRFAEFRLFGSGW